MFVRIPSYSTRCVIGSKTGNSKGKVYLYRTFRNIVTILTFAVVTGSLLSTYFLIGGGENSTQAGMNRLGADMLVMPGQYAADVDAIILSGRTSTFFFNSSVLSGVSNVSGVDKVAPQTYIATLNFGCCSFPTQLISFNATNDFTYFHGSKRTSVVHWKGMK